jgi:hypothetical protein
MAQSLTGSRLVPLQVRCNAEGVPHDHRPIAYETDWFVRVNAAKFDQTHDSPLPMKRGVSYVNLAVS